HRSATCRRCWCCCADPPVPRPTCASVPGCCWTPAATRTATPSNGTARAARPRCSTPSNAATCRWLSYLSTAAPPPTTTPSTTPANTPTPASSTCSTGPGTNGWCYTSSTSRTPPASSGSSTRVSISTPNAACTTPSPAAEG